MLVKDVMTRNVQVVFPDTRVQEAAETMRRLDVGVVPVCDNDRIIGIVTDRDITIRATAEGFNPNVARVHEIMSTNIAYCMEDQDIEEAANLMKSRLVRRLPVLNKEKRVVGIVTLGDIAVAARNEHLTAETLESVSHPIDS